MSNKSTIPATPQQRHAASVVHHAAADFLGLMLPTQTPTAQAALDLARLRETGASVEIACTIDGFDLHRVVLRLIAAGGQSRQMAAVYVNQ